MIQYALWRLKSTENELKEVEEEWEMKSCIKTWFSKQKTR